MKKFDRENGVYSTIDFLNNVCYNGSKRVRFCCLLVGIKNL